MPLEKKIEDMTKEDFIDLVWNALNKANTKGVYTIDEAYVLKIAITKLKEL